MGNCLVIQDRKEIKVITMDGEILELPPPLKVVQDQGAIAGFPPGHGVDGEMILKQRLFPAKAPAAAVAADPGVVRMKLVISKQELRRMLGKQEAISLDDVVSLMRRESDDQEKRCRGWRPALHSIPEGSDF